MFNFKALLATAAVAAGAIATPSAVEAASGYCYTTTRGADVCITRVVQTGHNTKRVWSVVNGHYSVDNVYCNPAHRYNYVENLSGIACFQFS